MMSATNRILAVCTLLAMVIPGSAQRIKASLDSANILVGDQARYSLTVSFPREQSIIAPEFRDTLVTGVEILAVEGPDTSFSDSTTEIRWTYVITAFDSAYHIIPPVALSYMLPGDSVADTLYSEAFLLSTFTLPVDMEKGPVDIKPPYPFPLTWQEILRYAGLGLLALLIAGIVAWVIIRRRQGKSLIPGLGRKLIPPHVEALSALEALRQEGLWQKGEIKEYYTRLSVILRTYIERQFGIPALESTSFELMAAIRDLRIAPALHPDLDEFFSRSDLVKFAKGAPLPDEHSHSFTVVSNFVHQTMPVEEDKEGGKP